MAKVKGKIYFVFLCFFYMLLSSCAHVPLQPPVVPSHTAVVPAPVIRQDVFHVVAPGETVWRISKMYEVSIDDIIKANSLKSPQSLKMGQRLLVPDAAPIKPVVTLYPSNKWKYIIIHHSASDEGNAFFIFNVHRKRGFSNIGYHFIIDNGTDGKLNGQIETSPRWLKQQDGAHCKASGMNHRGIGICLVGNFSKERVPKEQLDSLVYLVNTLRKYYKVPLKNIMGHGQVPGARTECPGKYFPWYEFNKELISRK